MLEKGACNLQISLATRISYAVCPAWKVRATEVRALQEGSSRITIYAMKKNLPTGAIPHFNSTLS